MFGNILNNKALEELVRAKVITIVPFHKQELKTVHYPIHAGAFFEREGIDNSGSPVLRRVHTFDKDVDRFEFRPNQFCVVEIEEHLVVPEGIIGHFIPASDLVEAGFSVTAGRLEHPFGFFDGKTQKVRFGVKNLTDQINPMGNKMKLAYIYFVDLRGLNNLSIELSEHEIRQLARRIARIRIAEDDGVNYGDGS